MTNTRSKLMALDTLITLQTRRFLAKFTPATVVIRNRHNPPPQCTTDDTPSTPVMEATHVPNTISMPHHMTPPMPVLAPPPPATTVKAATLYCLGGVTVPIPRMPPASLNHDPSDHSPLATTGRPHRDIKPPRRYQPETGTWD